MKQQNRNILSIQSSVASGYVGGNVASFIIQLHGFDPISIPTVILSNHTGHKEVRGETTSPLLFSSLIKGIQAIDSLYQIQDFSLADTLVSRN